MLNQGLHYYHSNVLPVEKKMLEKLLECIPIFYSYYRHPHSKISKKECGTLKELIATQLTHLRRYAIPHELNAERDHE